MNHSTSVSGAMVPNFVGALASGDIRPDGVASFYRQGGVERLSLSELDDRASRVAGWLARRGLRAGQRFGILAQNSLEWVLLDLAAIKLGAVTAGFEVGAFEASNDLVNRYELEFLFTSESEPSGQVIDIASVADARMHERYDGAAPACSLSDYTTIKFTSGSTGIPKGLGATIGSINSSIAAVQDLFAHTPDDKLMVFLPLSLLQQRYWVYSALIYGHDVVVSTHPLALYASKEERPTVVMGVPAFFETVMRQVENKARRLAKGPDKDDAEACRALLQAAFGDRIRYLWTGSAPARPDMLKFFNEHGFPIFEGYGMNETCIVTKNTPSANRVGSAGRVLPRKRIRIEDGVLVVSSDYPVNTRYLYGSDEAQKIFRANGDVVTGDLARIDDDGYLYILGRADEVVSLANGRNVHVRGIEDWVKENADVQYCIVVGAGKDRLKAVISNDLPVDRESVERCIAAFNAQASDHERIGEVVLADEAFSVSNGLLSSQGKPKRSRIRHVYGD